MSAMFAKKVTWWLHLLYIFITREFWYLGIRKTATPKYLDQVNLTLKTFQWPWFRSYNTFGSKLVWSEYLVHSNHILTPTFEPFDTIRPWSYWPNCSMEWHDLTNKWNLKPNNIEVTKFWKLSESYHWPQRCNYSHCRRRIIKEWNMG